MVKTVLFITTFFVLETFTSFVLAIIAVDMCLPTSRLSSISVVDAPNYCNNGVSGVKEEHGKKAKMDRKRSPNDVIWFIFSCSHSAWRILVWSFCGGVHFGISVNGNSKLCISFFPLSNALCCWAWKFHIYHISLVLLIVCMVEARLLSEVQDKAILAVNEAND